MFAEAFHAGDALANNVLEEHRRFIDRMMAT